MRAVGPSSPPDPSEGGAGTPAGPERPGIPARPERPEGLAARLLELGEELRREGLAIGTSELLDAFAVLREIEWTAQRDFREALAATLAKSQDDRRVFELVFDRFFFRAVELAAASEGLQETLSGEEAGLDLEELDEEQLEALRRQIAAALQEGSEGAMRDLARLAIAAFGRRQEGSGVVGVDVQRIRRSLGLRAEPQPDLPPEDPRREGLPRESLRRFEALLRREARNARRSSAPAACPRRARWANSTGRCPRGRCRISPRCTAASPRCAGALAIAGQAELAGTAITRTSTCGARCAPPCRPAGCRSCSSTAPGAPAAPRYSCSATSPRA